jgi:NAD(P)H-dependent flavin oxidoreductase YrpB (nitropropane dioxygenase family)
MKESAKSTSWCSTVELRTPLCDLFGIRYPILLAGMGGRRGLVVPPELVAAVSNAGGLGVTGLTDLPPEEIRRSIRRIRELTDRPFGVDLLLPASMEDPGGGSFHEAWQRLGREYPKHVEFVRKLAEEFNLPLVRPSNQFIMSPQAIREQVDVVLEERVPLFAAALGDPGWVVPNAHAVGTKVLGLAGSARHALRHKEAGVDLIVAQGYEAGGHVGKIGTFVLIPEVVDTVAPIPVIAAGGIVDGRGVAAALALGAQGAWIGTAFLLSEESRLFDAHKRAIITARTEDFVVTRAYTGKTARDVRNVIIERWERSGLAPLPMPLQGILFRDFLAAAELAGCYDLINNPAGQGGGRLHAVRPAREIYETIVREAIEVLEGMPRRVHYARKELTDVEVLR